MHSVGHLEAEAQPHNSCYITALQVYGRELVKVVRLEFVAGKIATGAVCVPATVFALGSCGRWCKSTGVIVSDIDMRIAVVEHLINSPERQLVVTPGLLVEGFLRDSRTDTTAHIIVHVVLGILGVREFEAQPADRSVG